MLPNLLLRGLGAGSSPYHHTLPLPPRWEAHGAGICLGMDGGTGDLILGPDGVTLGICNLKGSR